MPRPLLGLLAAVAVVGIAWALVVPPWQSPDSFTHYAYTESLATRSALPGRAGHPESSSSTSAAMKAAGTLGAQWSPLSTKPTWNPALARGYRRQSGRLSRSDGGGPTPSSSNPPVYYALAAMAYLSSVGGDALDRVTTVQLWGVVLLLATVLGAWLLAGEVFGRRRLLQLSTAAVAGLQPMVPYISTSVTPDALLITSWTFVLWLGARVVRRGAPRRDAIALCSVTALAILTKETSYALIPAVAFAVLAGLLRSRRRGWRETADAVLLPAIALAVPVLVWIAAATRTGRAALTIKPPTAAITEAPSSFISGLFDYVWQFYLPRLPGQGLFRLPRLGVLPWPRFEPGLPLWNVWIREGWGVFGWVDLYLPGWIYVVLAAVTGAVAAAGAAIIARFRDRLRLALVAFFALAFAALLAVSHVIEYETLRGGTGAFIQGRYLLPVIGLLGLGVALIVSRLPVRARGPVTAVLLVSLLAVQVIALATVMKAYYT